MSILEPSPASDRALALLRIVAGGVLVSAGCMKLFGFPPGPQPMPPVPLVSQLGLAAVLEIFGGLAIVVGFMTRPVAFVLSGEMAVAYFQVHLPMSPYPTANQGMPAILYSFLFLYLAFRGAGAWSLDGVLRRAGPREERQHDIDSHPAGAWR